MASQPRFNKSVEAAGNGQEAPQNRSIFREEAQQHYLANQERIVFPRHLTSKFFAFLWIAALVLLVFGLIITFWPLIEPWLWGIR